MTERAALFRELDYVVDRLHIKGHVGEWCLTNCHPDLFPHLEGCNTVICEQLNFWLSKYKYIFKHMNHLRFNFFLYIILETYNEMKCNKRFKLAESVYSEKFFAIKRPRSEFSDKETQDV